MDASERKYEFVWRIENFNSRLPKIGNIAIDNKCLESPHFNFYLFGMTEWYLELYPKTGRNGAFIKCLPICSDYSKDCPVTIEISLLTNNNQVYSSKKVKGRCSGVFHCDFTNAIELERAKLPSQNDLIIRCILLNEEDEGNYEDVLNDYEELSRDLEQFYSKELLNDLTLCVGREKFPVHRALLCVRAPKLAEKLDIQDEDNCKKIVCVENISSPVMKSLLTYLYTGKLNENIDDKLVELCEVAKEYNLVHLQADLLPIPVFSSVCTKVKSSKEVFNWQINHFNSMQTSVSRLIYLEHGQMMIRLTRLETHDLQMSFEMVSFLKGHAAFFRCKLCVADKGGNSTTLFYDDEHCFESNESTKDLGVISKTIWKFPHLLSNNDLISNKDKYLPDGSLTLKLELETTDGEKVNEILLTRKFIKDQSSNISHMNHLANDLLDIFKVKNRPCVDGGYYDGDCYNDVTLKVGDDEISCHKFILGARSPVFAKMLLTNARIKEIKTDLAQTEHNILLLLVQYIYSGKITNVTAAIEASKLYLAAVRYQVESLMQNSILLLEKLLSIQNICEVVVFSDKYLNQSLLRATYKFIKLNRNDVFDSEEWKQLVEENPKLTTKVISEIKGSDRSREFYRGGQRPPRGPLFRVVPQWLRGRKK